MNILIITPYYPVLNNPKLNNQPQVVHYFAKDWVAKGHDVLVVHTYPHKLADSVNLPKVISSFRVEQANVQLIDEVKVALIEWYRWKPGSFQLTKTQEANTFSFVLDAVSQWGVFPDRIVCHFPGACMWLMKRLKKKYDCPQIAMFHNIDLSLIKQDDSLFFQECEQVYSSLGFRSKNIKREFETMVKLSDVSEIKLPTFIASSGVPKSILQPTPRKYRVNNSMRLTFVGRLDKNKNVETTLYALSNLLNKKVDFKFTIIGEGKREKLLRKLSNKLGLEERVQFLGSVQRKYVFEELNKSDVFVMLSHRETLGLVYLEAMACGCIVIGSSGTGVDGIVKDGENGFLVNSNAVVELSKTILEIYQMNVKQRNRILLNSFNTIHEYTDQNMANSYLDNLINIK